MGTDVLQAPKDGSWDWGRSGQESSLRLVAVLVGHVRDLDELTLGRVPREASVGVVSSDSGLLGGDAVAGLVLVVVVALGLDVGTDLGDVGTSFLVVGGGTVGAGQDGGGDEQL